jgi:DNA-binding NarL/FixJ family response regulator
VRLLVVDDHEIVREGLAAALEGDGRSVVVAAVGRGDDAMRIVRAERIDVAIVDLRLPDMSGHSLTAAIREASPSTRIVVLSTYLSEESVRLSREAGADAYVAKSSGVSELRAALARLHDDAPLDESPAEVVRRLRSDESESLLLTPQQERVLTLAAAGHTDKEIASRLFLSESTVRFHMQRLKDLLGVRTKSQVVVEALRRDLIRPEPIAGS